MSIKKKLAFIYFSITVALFLVLSTFVVIFNGRRMREDALDTLSNYTETVKQQYLLQLSSYDQATISLLSDNEFVQSIRTLSQIDRLPENEAYLERAYREINEQLANYTKTVDFFRVNVISSDGDFLTNDFNLSSINEEAFNRLTNLMSVGDNSENITMVSNFQDIWGGTTEFLFTYIREVNFSNGAQVFIEIEDKQDSVSQIVNLNIDNQMSFFIVDSNNRLMTYTENADLGKLQSYLTKEDASLKNYAGALVYQVPLENNQRIIAFQELTAINSAIVSTTVLVLIIGLSLLALLYILFKLQLDKILNPLEDLKTEMENLSIATLPKNSHIESNENEIISLSESYNELKNRLNQSIENELTAQRKQFDANMEVLQAQIDPHFIYNIMNIIAYKGYEHDDKDTVEIAQGITDMLRYSTSNVEKHASFEREFSHVENYLLLMKKRYEEMLHYSVELPDELKHIEIPKLVLQIFAENSIKYSFSAGKESVNIMIRANTNEKNEWEISISDDGPGINDERVREIEKKMIDIKENLAIRKSLKKLDFEIGGLGIINTYARLKLFYGVSFDMSIKTSDSGTCIKLWKRKL